MPFSSSERQAFTISLSLHGAVLLVLLLVMLWGYLFQEKPEQHVFELVSPSAQQPAPTEPAEAPADLPPLAVDEMPEAPDIPELPKPKPQPAPVREPEPPPAKPISAEDFYKQFGKPDTPTTQTRTPRKVEVKEINVREMQQQLMRNLTSVADQQRVSNMSTADQDLLNQYFAALRSRLNATWQQPQDAPAGLYAEVSFYLDANGNISQVRIVKSSGREEFDRSVLQAFRSLGRYQPTPDRRDYPLRIPFRVLE